jgi:hypothetical protein
VKEEGGGRRVGPDIDVDGRRDATSRAVASGVSVETEERAAGHRRKGPNGVDAQVVLRYAECCATRTANNAARRRVRGEAPGAARGK